MTNQQNDLCVKRRLRSAWASAQSGICNTRLSEDSDQTGWMPKLIGVFAGFSGRFVMRSTFVTACIDFTCSFLFIYEQKHNRTATKRYILCIQTQIRLYNCAVWLEYGLCAWRSFVSYLPWPCGWAGKSESSLAMEQIRRVFCDNFTYFSIKTYVVGTH